MQDMGKNMQDASKSMQQWRCEKESLENLSTLLQLLSQLVLHESNKASVLSTDQDEDDDAKSKTGLERTILQDRDILPGVTGTKVISKSPN